MRLKQGILFSGPYMPLFKTPVKSYTTCIEQFSQTLYLSGSVCDVAICSCVARCDCIFWCNTEMNVMNGMRIA